MTGWRRFEEISPYIREVGLQRQDSWRNMQRRIFDHQFFYCFTGIVHIVLREETYRLQPGDLLIVPPNVPHQLWVDEAAPGELYWFHCDLFMLEDREWVRDFYVDMERYITLFGAELPHKEHIRENPVFEGGYTLPAYCSFLDTEPIEYCFRMMHKSFLSGERVWQITAKRCFFEILDALLKRTMEAKNADEHKTYVVNQIKSYVAKHYFEQITIQDMCADTGLNTEYASKLFRQQTGMKLVEYVGRFRVAQSKKLLIDRDLNIADIADMVGFSSENYYSNVTKKYEGKAPARLREHLLAMLTDEENR